MKTKPMGEKKEYTNEEFETILDKSGENPMTTAKPNGWEKNYDDLCPDKGTDYDTKKKFNPFPAKGSPSYLAHKSFISQAILSAEERAREEERERILDDGHLWFETHFTPEDPDAGMFEGIQEHLGEREFIKLVQNKK